MTAAQIILIARRVWGHGAELPVQELERFAHLLLAADREVSAQLCDGLPAPASCAGVEKSLWGVAALACAQAIRARSPS